MDEPAIVEFAVDIHLLRQVLEPLWDARGAAQLVLATYGGDAEPLYAQLNSLPADIIALDVARNPGLAAVIAAPGASKILGLGVVGGGKPELGSAGSPL